MKKRNINIVLQIALWSSVGLLYIKDVKSILALTATIAVCHTLFCIYLVIKYAESEFDVSRIIFHPKSRWIYLLGISLSVLMGTISFVYTIELSDRVLLRLAALYIFALCAVMFIWTDTYSKMGKD